jgi:hypothetical protein
LPHVAVVLSGTLHVVMDDGSAEEFSTGDVMLLPPGHDAWTVGHEPCVFVEFSRGNDYYTPHTHGVHLVRVVNSSGSSLSSQFAKSQADGKAVRKMLTTSSL